MSFDLQPILKGDLLELRPLRPTDFHELYAVASDPLIWEQHPIKDRYQEEVFKAFFREALESRGALIAIDSKDSQVIGSSRFHGYEKEKSEIEIGWTFLARSHWGGLYSAEMKQLMLRHAFKFVNSVIFLVGAQNLRSQRACRENRRSSCGIKAGRERSRQFCLSNHRVNLPRQRSSNQRRHCAKRTFQNRTSHWVAAGASGGLKLQITNYKSQII